MVLLAMIVDPFVAAGFALLLIGSK